MKKITFISLCLVLAFCTCHKAEKKQIHESTATLLNNDSKSNYYSLITYLGHTRSDCGGKCVYINGQLCHFDCMGYGNACAASAIVSLVQVSGDEYTATTIDSTALTNEDFFNMPSRSLFVGYDEKNHEIWLNIPAQIVYRDPVSRQFTFTGLYYNDTQVFGNN